jgi:hypothetical protein
VPRRAAWLPAVLVVGAATSALAQSPAPDPPGPYVVDVRVASAAFPDVVTLFPPGAGDLLAPSRGLGVEIGAHVYLGRLGAARLGWGAGVLKVRGREVPPPTASTGPPAGAATGPAGLEVDLLTVAPQLSFNFGTSEGWSYLSLGAGVTDLAVQTVSGVAARRDVDGILTLNGGGGARWFMTGRVAVGFDLRLYRLSAAETMPASMRFAVSGGVSFR